MTKRMYKGSNYKFYFITGSNACIIQILTNILGSIQNVLHNIVNILIYSVK